MCQCWCGCGGCSNPVPLHEGLPFHRDSSAKEKYPEAKPRIISDNGPQFIARDFKEFICISLAAVHAYQLVFASPNEKRRRVNGGEFRILKLVLSDEPRQRAIDGVPVVFA
jgi:hypothetical protein